ncbi:MULTISPECIES: aldose epimerase family protein [Nocardioides]|uniref:Aldose 1-epimerase n=1 Tax=Nocardioides vastitatis TaxID=2568655 RepID=A0ABW0ZIM2_9ACTN|nr:aldose epimerase family protein [Nocardioides sp.]
MNDTTPPDVVIGQAPGPELHLLDVGATVQRLIVTGGDGLRRDVALGLPDAAAVRASTDYIGSIVGRYANRVAHGRLSVDGREMVLPANDRGHHLHGGPDGFHTRAWRVVEHSESSVLFELVSPDGDAGYAGELTARARYSVTADSVELDLTATTTAPTVVNLTSHAYLNLNGAGTIDDHVLTVAASRYTPVDETSIPTGDHASVEGTPFDLRRPTRLGERVRSAHPEMRAARGIDHNLVVDGSGWRSVAVLDSPATRTRMELWSDQPGLQVYTGNFFDGSSLDRDGRSLRQGDGIALEPQRHPDTPNHPSGPDWPSAVLRPGESYRSRIAWVFSALP